MDNSNLIYHYTSFEKLQCILKYGTLRFKESTSSNDILDTIGFENILKSMPNFNAPGATAALLNFIINYYRWEGYHPSAKFLVACFSKIPDFFGMPILCIALETRSALMERKSIVLKWQRNITVYALPSVRTGYQSICGAWKD